MVTRIQWLAALAAMCGTGVICAAIGTATDSQVPSSAPSASSGEAALSFEASLSPDATSEGETDTVYARYRIESAAVSTVSWTQPLDVALVVDSSGSMVGEPMNWARSASLEVIDALPPGSRLALVSFSERAVLHHSLVNVEENRAALKRSVGELDAAGGTHLSGGFSFGHEELQRDVRRDALRRIVVVSDGKPTLGLTAPENLQQMASDAAAEGITVTTLGVGLDFEEGLLGQMAMSGEGNFYFVEDEETLRKSLVREVEGLGTATASQTELHLQPAPGVRIQRVFGFRSTREGDSTVVSVDTMFAESQRDILVQMVVDRDEWEPGAVVDASLRYRPLVTHRRSPLVEERVVQSLSTMATGSEGAVDLGVIERVREVLSAEAVAKANAAWNRGDETTARVLVDRTIIANQRFLDLAGSPKTVERVQAKLRELRREITSQKHNSPAARRYRKKTKSATIEIIRGNRL